MYNSFLKSANGYIKKARSILFCAFKMFSDMPCSKDEKLQTFQIELHLCLDQKGKTAHWPLALDCHHHCPTCTNEISGKSLCR